MEVVVSAEPHLKRSELFPYRTLTESRLNVRSTEELLSDVVWSPSRWSVPVHAKALLLHRSARQLTAFHCGPLKSISTGTDRDAPEDTCHEPTFSCLVLNTVSIEISYLWPKYSLDGPEVVLYTFWFVSSLTADGSGQRAFVTFILFFPFLCYFNWLFSLCLHDWYDGELFCSKKIKKSNTSWVFYCSFLPA